MRRPEEKRQLGTGHGMKFVCVFGEGDPKLCSLGLLSYGLGRSEVVG